MSHAALKLLTKAYDSYLKTRNPSFLCLSKNGDDLFNNTEAACELHEDGYIADVDDFILDGGLNPLVPVGFTITPKGLGFMRTHREP